MDAAMEDELKQAAQVYEEAPKRLRAAIIKAAFDRGEKPAAITRAIGYVYTPDYVARLVRDERKRRAAAAQQS